MSKSKQKNLARIQALSGLLFGAFLLLHLFNTMLGAVSPGTYDQAQRLFRTIYTFAPVELVLLGAILVHVYCGVRRILMRRRDKSSAPASLRIRLHRYAAWFLMLVVFGHVAATRLPALLFDAPPFFAGVNFALWWLPAVFWPYYLALALAGLFHGLHGSILAVRLTAAWRGHSFKRRVGARGFWTIVAVGSVLLGVGLAGLGGLLYPVHDPTDNDYARVYESEFGVELD